MPRRYYSSTAARTTLASGVNNSTTTFSVTAVSGWPTSFPYTLVIDQDTVNEEIVEVTARSGTTLTVVRGVDNTAAVAHSAGAAVNHGVSARDFDEPNAFINGTGTVTDTLLASGSVTEAKIGTSAVTEAKIASNAVTSAKILDGTIVNADISASAAIAQSKISNLTSDLASKLDTTVTTKGDLITRSSSGPARLGVGSNGQVLVADSAATLGIKWAAASSGGKLLQLQRVTLSTARTTTSTSETDVTGLSLTITPLFSTSAILLIASLSTGADSTTTGSEHVGFYNITDNSNNSLSGGSYVVGSGYYTINVLGQQRAASTFLGYSTPATTSAVTYKVRFRSAVSTTTARCDPPSAFYALEIGA